MTFLRQFYQILEGRRLLLSLSVACGLLFALTNLVCARLPLTPGRIWLFSYVGLLPRTLLATYLGSQLQDWRALIDPERPPWELLLSLVLFALLFYVTRRAARQFESREGSTDE